jgi:hypothetical protein
MAIIENTKGECWKVCEEKETLVHWGWGYVN